MWWYEEYQREASISQKSSWAQSRNNAPCHSVMDLQLGVFFDVHPPPRKSTTCDRRCLGQVSALAPCQPPTCCCWGKPVRPSHTVHADKGRLGTGERSQVILMWLSWKLIMCVCVRAKVLKCVQSDQHCHLPEENVTDGGNNRSQSLTYMIASESNTSHCCECENSWLGRLQSLLPLRLWAIIASQKWQSKWCFSSELFRAHRQGGKWPLVLRGTWQGGRRCLKAAGGFLPSWLRFCVVLTHVR